MPHSQILQGMFLSRQWVLRHALVLKRHFPIANRKDSCRCIDNIGLQRAQIMTHHSDIRHHSHAQLPLAIFSELGPSVAFGVALGVSSSVCA